MDALDDKYREELNDSEPEEIVTSGLLDAPGDEVLSQPEEILEKTDASIEQTDEFLEETDEVLKEEAPVIPSTAVNPDRSWFVIHCYSGYENKVRYNLEQRIETMGMKDRIFDVVIPTQEEIEVKEGKRRTVERHVFPGYVLVNMVLSEESWYVVRNTPGVTGFVGMGNDPTPLRPEEVQQILRRMEAEAPLVKVSFKVGERVRIVDGPFNDFRGLVSEIDMERTKVRVLVNFFGRETPVELDFLQVEKA
jgi:transcriptional antiterminator NusG